MEKIHLNETLDEIIKELDEKNLLYLTSSKIKELKIIYYKNYCYLGMNC